MAFSKTGRDSEVGAIAIDDSAAVRVVDHKAFANGGIQTFVREGVVQREIEDWK